VPIANAAAEGRVSWSVAPMEELTPTALYALLTLRQRVFIVEQNCVYLDCDGRDLEALHLMGYTEDRRLVAYARLLAPGTAFAEASIGRVVTAPELRRAGCGRPLVGEAIAQVRAHFGGSIRIGAQHYLQHFYAEFGFVTEGEIYLEDGIPHIEMLLR
jgi:ElaA protein